MTHPETDPKPYETSDWHFRIVLLFLAILSIGALISVGATYVIHGALSKYDRAKIDPISPVADLRRMPPEPRLQVDDAGDMAKLREHEDSILNSYGWVDTQSGQVRIPIDRAIDLVAERGLPSRKGTGQ